MKIGLTVAKRGHVERHELQTFLTLAEELHFGRTATRLRVSTARVSQTIRTLERRVGAPLFHRTSRSVELLPLGRQLYDELKPAWYQIISAFSRAVDAGRGISGTLTAAYIGAAAGNLLTRAAGLFGTRHPGCRVHVREAQIVDVLPWIRSGDVDVALVSMPVHDSELAVGPVLIREARMLAVPAGHPFACRDSVSVEDLARTPVLQFAEVPDAYRDDRTPATTPGGKPITRGASARTFNEILTLVGAGQGVFPVGSQAVTYYQRPDVVYVPFSDAEPLEWALIWLAGRSAVMVRAFGDTAQEITCAGR